MALTCTTSWEMPAIPPRIPCASLCSFLSLSVMLVRSWRVLVALIASWLFLRESILSLPARISFIIRTDFERATQPRRTRNVANSMQGCWSHSHQATMGR